MDINSLRKIIKNYSITSFREKFKDKGPEIVSTNSEGYSILHTSIDALSKALDSRDSDGPLIERHVAAVRFFYEKSDKNQPRIQNVDDYFFSCTEKAHGRPKDTGFV